MSRESLCNDWQQALAHCESCAATAPPRYQWLYQVRARIYRLLLAMYGEDESWVVPDELPEEPAGMYVAASVADIDEAPALKSNAQILQTLKRIAEANPGVPSGDFTWDLYRKLPCLVADVTKLKYVQPISDALRQGGIRFRRRIQGGHYQFLVDPEDRDEAMKVIAEYHLGKRQRLVRAQRAVRCARRELVTSLGVTFTGMGLGACAYAAMLFGLPDASDYLMFGVTFLMFGLTCIVLDRILNRRRIQLEIKLKGRWPAAKKGWKLIRPRAKIPASQQI